MAKSKEQRKLEADFRNTKGELFRVIEGVNDYLDSVKHDSVMYMKDDHDWYLNHIKRLMEVFDQFPDYLRMAVVLPEIQEHKPKMSIEEATEVAFNNLMALPKDEFVRRVKEASDSPLAIAYREQQEFMQWIHEEVDFITKYLKRVKRPVSCTIYDHMIAVVEEGRKPDSPWFRDNQLETLITGNVVDQVIAELYRFVRDNQELFSLVK